jgi:hypothetical protein
VEELLYGPDPALLTVESLGWVDEQLPDAEEVA